MKNIPETTDKERCMIKKTKKLLNFTKWFKISLEKKISNGIRFLIIIPLYSTGFGLSSVFFHDVLYSFPFLFLFFLVVNLSYLEKPCTFIFSPSLSIRVFHPAVVGSLWYMPRSFSAILITWVSLICSLIKIFLFLSVIPLPKIIYFFA